MQSAGLDALIVCGNQYAGFEGAALYVSGFEIVFIATSMLCCHSKVNRFWSFRAKPAGSATRSNRG